MLDKHDQSMHLVDCKLILLNGPPLLEWIEIAFFKGKMSIIKCVWSTTPSPSPIRSNIVRLENEPLSLLPPQGSQQQQHVFIINTNNHKCDDNTLANRLQTIGIKPLLLGYYCYFLLKFLEISSWTTAPYCNNKNTNKVSLFLSISLSLLLSAPWTLATKSDAEVAATEETKPQHFLLSVVATILDGRVHLEHLSSNQGSGRNLGLHWSSSLIIHFFRNCKVLAFISRSISPSEGFAFALDRTKMLCVYATSSKIVPIAPNQSTTLPLAPLNLCLHSPWENMIPRQICPTQQYCTRTTFEPTSHSNF